ncbi:hypothetical protein [Clostridium sp. Ade.TY]|uniref:hypothetical protein n=1 Tax=Clostridium sp. Ade.TY TaxID=1391647 RepID=UPI0004222DC8|nr:hypothetical protein [Clostridium sp. Ade.TY]
MKKIISILLTILVTLSLFVGCGTKTEELKEPTLDKNITFGDLKLDYSKYTLETKGKQKTLKVELTYKANVMIVGKVEKIRNTIVREFGDKVDEIKLNIKQFKPIDGVEYTYKDGKWDKPVE